MVNYIFYFIKWQVSTCFSIYNNIIVTSYQYNKNLLPYIVAIASYQGYFEGNFSYYPMVLCHYANIMATTGLHMHNKVLKAIGSSYTINQFFQRSLLAIVLVESR